MATLTRRQPSRICGVKHLLPSFFLGGFESSTPINQLNRRIDEIALTRHDLLVRSDYRRLRGCGVCAARDGIRWNLVDRRGRLDFSSALPFVNAAEEVGVTIIWDLFHYGYPDDLDPFQPPFVERFAAYAQAFARLLVRRSHGERNDSVLNARFYTPVNEISFFSWAGGEEGIFAPHTRGQGGELKRRLAEASIAGMDAIREVDPLARFVHCDPIVRVVPPADEPWLAGEARHFNEQLVWEAWDMLAGRAAPELGGSPAHLDILGVNYYGVNQWEHSKPDNVLGDDDPRRVPFSQLLIDLYDRYEHPIVVTETASYGEDRCRWLRRISRECRKAVEQGVDLHGLCLYPIVGMADWQSEEFRPMGLWDRCCEKNDWRVPVASCLETLDALQREWRRQLDSRASGAAAALWAA